ncbi:hypothetical protein Taro_024598 [Colocasia esculenta]|uniref:PWWP domain-containing protein n=1 Tax=Colocasia esculenta TaxID=4460 RepID=A0A843V6Q6_COLES|nr:hypothetical protein [Colocasia esculenta]
MTTRHDKKRDTYHSFIGWFQYAYMSHLCSSLSLSLSLSPRICLRFCRLISYEKIERRAATRSRDRIWGEDSPPTPVRARPFYRFPIPTPPESGGALQKEEEREEREAKEKRRDEISQNLDGKNHWTRPRRAHRIGGTRRRPAVLRLRGRASRRVNGRPRSGFGGLHFFRVLVVWVGGMGAPEGVGGVECGVGAIVWVRRRNGSWWPGRILGQEELSASHLMSPRSGTPVKLLGREDASVDWYNLEKSKRVKPFRCGDFDACIERAEASQGVPIKKREKYARREDAILHALELEKQYMEKQRQKSGTNSNTLSHKFSGNLKKMMNNHSSSGLHLSNNEPSEPENPELQSQSRKAGLPFEERSGDMPLHSQKGKHAKRMNWEDNNSVFLPHMRGLKEFDAIRASLKRKEASSALSEGSPPASFDNHVDDISESHGIVEVNHTSDVKAPMGIKRKGSHVALMEQSLLKRQDRHRPLTQVLHDRKLSAKSSQGNCEQKSSLGKEEKEQIEVSRHAKRRKCLSPLVDSSDCFVHTGHSSEQMQMSPTKSGYSNGHQPGLLEGEEASSGLIGDGETSSSEGDYLVADLDEDTVSHQDAKSFGHGSTNSEEHASKCISTFSDQEKLGKISDNYHTSLSDYKIHTVSDDQTGGTGGIGVSKWHMKGKRNIRNVTRKYMEGFDGKDSVVSSDKCDGSLDGSVERKPFAFKTGWQRLSGQGLYDNDEELNYVYDDDGFFERENRMIGFGKHSYPLMLKAASRDHMHDTDDSDEDSHQMFPSIWEPNKLPHSVRRAYWEESDEFLGSHSVHPLNVGMAPRLVDVNLKVQASYQGEHVPLVSLMSRLNGKAIIGHPVHIEILKDGSTDPLCPRNHLGASTTNVGELAAPTAWRTGKRTAMQRVPRPHLTPLAQGEESEFIPYSDGGGRPLFRKPHAAPTHWSSLMKSSKHLKFQKQLSKKRSLPGQKTRTLSSIATEKKSNRVKASSKHRRKGSGLDGLIKPGSTVPLVTCVPVKVVFTRILEAVGRTSSTSMAHQTLASSISATVVGSRSCWPLFYHPGLVSCNFQWDHVHDPDGGLLGVFGFSCIQSLLSAVAWNRVINRSYY